MENVTWGLGFLLIIVFLLVFQVYMKVGELQRHVRLLLKHANIDVTNPPDVSDRVKTLARDPSQKIQTIKLLREETGVGLAEAKMIVEDIARNSNA